ncbi:MAG TPA: hypothetical protein VHW02_04835 [Rhizomicrobium sp.]|jgi:hypothetical protein|nr:hypothetical protein [Rhizomicrobium sp.]
MFVPVTGHKWSSFALRALIASLGAALVFAFLDGIIRYNIGRLYDGTPVQMMISTWVVDFRVVAEQVMLAAAVVFVGAKFIETRTIFTVGFDKLDAVRVKVKGPDENNVVWVGHAYANNLEAQAVSDTIAERLKQSAEKD